MTINSGIDVNHTSEMEKAMQQSHKMSYAEYGRKLTNRLEVEKRRQRDYEKSKILAADINDHIHK